MKPQSTSPHQCKDIMSKVMLSLDGALSAEEEKAFLNELNSCSCCLSKYEIEKSFKEFLSNKTKQNCCVDTLAATIRKKIKECGI